MLLTADAAEAERRACALTFSRSRERLDVGVGEVSREVSLDPVAVVATGVFHRLGALLGQDDEDRAAGRSNFG